MLSSDRCPAKHRLLAVLFGVLLHEKNASPGLSLHDVLAWGNDNLPVINFRDLLEHIWFFLWVEPDEQVREPAHLAAVDQIVEPVAVWVDYRVRGQSNNVIDVAGDRDVGGLKCQSDGVNLLANGSALADANMRYRHVIARCLGIDPVHLGGGLEELGCDGNQAHGTIGGWIQGDVDRDGVGAEVCFAIAHNVFKGLEVEMSDVLGGGLEVVVSLVVELCLRLAQPRHMHRAGVNIPGVAQPTWAHGR
jgi:hypothetical protein